MLASGDSDLLATLLDSFYLNWPLAQQRNRIYFNQSGAYWPEYTHPLIGTEHTQSYGCGRAGKTNPPIGYDEDRWNHYNFQGSLDLCLFILDHFQYTQDQARFNKFLPVIDDVLSFYRQRWTTMDPQGKIVMFPTQSLETWQCPDYPPNPKNCPTNDAPTVSGLYAVLSALIRLLPSSQTQPYTEFLSVLPPVPTTGTGSAQVLEPCAICPPSTSNVENTELYPVHPYRLFGVGKPNIQQALNAFSRKRFTRCVCVC